MKSVRIPMWILAAALCTASAAATPGAAGPDSPSFVQDASWDDPVELDKSKVRYGDASRFDPAKKHKVGTVRSKSVYEQIREAVEAQKHDRDSAKYRQLMAVATRKFKTALERVGGADQQLVLIVEQGGISGYPTSDLTSAIVDALPKDE